ncbi:MAG: AMP-binding protein [Ilumatobacteraceae bacterium]
MSEDHEAMRREYQELVSRRVAEAEARLSWSVEDRRSFTNDRLGEFLAFASSRSAWHRERLAGIDLGAVSIDDMSSLPTMNKRDLNGNWDAIVTDPDLTLEVANRHLDDISANGFSFALGRYVISATGGSTGVRSVIAVDAEAMAGWEAGNDARARSSRPADVDMPPVPVMGKLSARNPVHLSAATAVIFSGATNTSVVVPPSMPMPEGVAVLNNARPDVLVGYPSMLHLMALESQAGRLRISPKVAASAGEPLLPETRHAVRDAFGIDVTNFYGASEAFFARSWRGSELLHLNDDTVVFEFVDSDNQPVPVGTRSAKVLITNLSNRLQPLVRYEITDEVTEAIVDPDSNDPAQHPPGPWAGRWIHPPQGRADDWFTYGAIVVHPHLFRSELGADENITEYQVQQTSRGAHIDIVASGAVDRHALSVAIADELRQLGLTDPDVHIDTVDSLERHAQSGKLRRFIPKN